MSNINNFWRPDWKDRQISAAGNKKIRDYNLRQENRRLGETMDKRADNLILGLLTRGHDHTLKTVTSMENRAVHFRLQAHRLRGRPQ